MVKSGELEKSLSTRNIILQLLLPRESSSVQSLTVYILSSCIYVLLEITPGRPIPLEEKPQTRRFWEASEEITRAWRMITDKNGNPDSLSPTVSFLVVVESENIVKFRSIIYLTSLLFDLHFIHLFLCFPQIRQTANSDASRLGGCRLRTEITLPFLLLLALWHIWLLTPPRANLAGRRIWSVARDRRRGISPIAKASIAGIITSILSAKLGRKCSSSILTTELTSRAAPRAERWMANQIRSFV